MGLIGKELGMSAMGSVETLAEDLMLPAEGAAALPAPRMATAQGKAGYDRAVDALSRLPRPAMAFGTLALFVDAVIEPQGFEHRMQALAAMPDPLWWLIGAVMTFYFGAREAHYLRGKPGTPAPKA